MEKYTDSDSIAASSDAENTAFLNTHYQKQESQRRRTYVLLTLFNLFIFVLSMLSMICAVMSQKDSSIHEVAKLMDQFDIYSPAVHAVEFEKKDFNFPMPLNQSKYVGTTEDVDNAWMDISYMPDQMVSMENFPRLNKPSSALQVTDPKTGETGYRVGLEVFHQLHCLNLLRMSTYSDHYGNQTWAMINRTHLDHCIEVLRVNLMCMSDVNVFTFHEMPGKGYMPDYETTHVCRSFDKIQDWAHENAVPFQDV